MDGHEDNAKYANVQFKLEWITYYHVRCGNTVGGTATSQDYRGTETRDAWNGLAVNAIFIKIKKFIHPA
jgi:hypothetical protein